MSQEKRDRLSFLLNLPWDCFTWEERRELAQLRKEYDREAAREVE